MNTKVVELLNTQVNKELYSAYLYLDMANYYIEKGLAGFGNWYTIQAQEERDHAFLFMKYLQNNSEKVTLEAVAKPDKTFESAMDPLLAAAEHERYVTSLIDAIYDAANQAKDFRTIQFLSWFIKEQGEEETNADDLINKFKLFGNDAKGLYLLNQEMAGRVYNPPSLVL